MIEPATVLVENALQVVYRLASQVEEQALWVNSDVEEAMWECVALVCSSGHGLEIALGMLASGAESAEQYVGSVLETNVVGRGLLYHALELAVRAGIVGSESDVEEYRGLLDINGVPPVEIVVAYLDYLNTTEDMDGSFGEKYAMMARSLAADLPRFRWRSYYWTSSDTYTIFGTLSPENRDTRIASFVQDLIWVQRNKRTRDSHVGWMWQIGVTVAKAIVLGDVIMPSRNSAMAASLMKVAMRDHGKGGGLILVDPVVVKSLDVRDLGEVLLLGGEPDPGVAIELRDVGKRGSLMAYEIAELHVLDAGLGAAPLVAEPRIETS